MRVDNIEAILLIESTHQVFIVISGELGEIRVEIVRVRADGKNIELERGRGKFNFGFQFGLDEIVIKELPLVSNPEAP